MPWQASVNHSAQRPRHAAAQEDRRWRAARGPASVDGVEGLSARARRARRYSRGRRDVRPSIRKRGRWRSLGPGGGRGTCGLLRWRVGLLDKPGRLVPWKILARVQAITWLLPGVLFGLVIYCCFRKISAHIQASPWLHPLNPGGCTHAGPACGWCPPHVQESEIKSFSPFQVENNKISRGVKGFFRC